jgi:Arc/MetJ-type ribon-helix-helix transcriptional regulator
MTPLPHDSAGEGQGFPGGAALRPAAELAHLMEFLHDLGKASPEFKEMLERLETTSSAATGNVRPLGRARKVSVSMPEELTAAVQQRVGRGEFSQYVTEAVARQLELDLLNELAVLLEAEYGPVPEEFLAEAGAAWPDAE